MPRGGVREGAGRKANTPNKASQKRQEEVAETGETPLAYMLKIMRDDKAPEERRDEMAKAAAVYVHPRLSSVETNDVTSRRSSDQIDARIRQLLADRDKDGTARSVGGTPEGRGETTRDIVQAALMGPLGEMGTGLIPRASIVGEPSKRAGIVGAMDTVRVRWGDSGRVDEEGGGERH